jgi:hypothetical protein
MNPNMMGQGDPYGMNTGMSGGISGGMGDEYGITPPRFRDEESPEIGVIRELSPKKVKERIKKELEGMEWNESEKKWVKIKDFVPMMNSLGVQAYCNSLPVMSDTVTFSNYTVEQIMPMVLFAMESVIPTIYVNYKLYGITNKANLPILTYNLFVLTSAAYQKALGAGDRGVIGKTTSETILNRSGQMSQQNMPNERRGGFLSALNPFKR